VVVVLLLLTSTELPDQLFQKLQCEFSTYYVLSECKLFGGLYSPRGFSDHLIKVRRNIFQVQCIDERL